MSRDWIGRVVLSLLVLAGVGLLATADDKEKGAGKALTDKEFVMKAASGGMFEVESSKLALDKSRNEKVKKFAEKMIEDHGKANKELAKLAKDAGIEVPEKMDAKHQKEMEKLRDAGDRFDRAYIDAQVKGHEEAVELFSNQAKGGKNAELRQWAEKTLPTLRMHHKMIKAMAGGDAKDTPKRR